MPARLARKLIDRDLTRDEYYVVAFVLDPVIPEPLPPQLERLLEAIIAADGQ